MRSFATFVAVATLPLIAADTCHEQRGGLRDACGTTCALRAVACPAGYAKKAAYDRTASNAGDSAAVTLAACCERTCKSSAIKNWEKWLLAALGGLGCLAYAYCTDTFQVWWTDSTILAVPFEPRAEAAYVRDVVTETAEDLRRYVKEFDKKGMGCFVLVAGPQASGKTTSIEKAFEGWKGVSTIVMNLDATAGAADFAEVLSTDFAHLKGVPVNVARSRVSMMDDYCRKWYGHPLVIIISIKSGNKQLEGDQARVIAGKILDFGRGYTYDSPTCPIIFETSVPKVCVAAERVHQTARANRSQTTSWVATATSATRCTSLP